MMSIKARIRLENIRGKFGQSTMTIRSCIFKSTRVDSLAPEVGLVCKLYYID